MAQLFDPRGNEFTGNLDTITGQAFTDARSQSASLAAGQAETTIDLNGHATWAVQITGTWTGTVNFEGTLDGSNYTPVPMLAQATQFYVTTASANAFFYGGVAGFKRLRVRMSAYGSGTCVVFHRASAAEAEILAVPYPATLCVTTLGTANTATTLTLAAAGVGLYHYLDALELWLVNGTSTAVTPTALLSVTTTNLPGSLAWTFGNNAPAFTELLKLDKSLAQPLKSSVANTATTVVMPAAGAGVQWRATAYYHAGA